MYRRARKAAASLTVAVLIVAGLAVTAVVRDEPPPRAAVTSTTELAGPGPAAADRGAERESGDRRGRERDPFGASCRAVTEGSLVTADCHNPYPATDHVRLHIECARWWDLDSDSAAVEVPAARHVRLTGRCWQDVTSAWITHGRRAP